MTKRPNPHALANRWWMAMPGSRSPTVGELHYYITLVVCNSGHRTAFVARINSGTEHKADRAGGLDRLGGGMRIIGPNAARAAMGGLVMSVFDPPFRLGGPRSAPV
jgi:hypothetical protein